MTWTASRKRYQQSPEGRATSRAASRRYNRTQKCREAQRRYRRKRKLAAKLATPFHDCRVKVMDAAGEVVKVLTPDQFRKRRTTEELMVHRGPGRPRKSPPDDPTFGMRVLTPLYAAKAFSGR